MDDIAAYLISLRGWVHESEINPLSPYPMEFCQLEESPEYAFPLTQIRVHTDQSGLIGLLRYLHGKGFVVLSLRRME